MLKSKRVRLVARILTRIIQVPRVLVFRLLSNNSIQGKPKHFQPIQAVGRGKIAEAQPVYIGDDVFIGSNVKILKGVSIGDGSVIGNGAIVSKDIPSRAIAGGNPAKVIKMII